MSEIDDQNQQPTKSFSCSFSFFLKLLFIDPIKIFLQTKHIIVPVLFSFTLPLSLLLFSLSLSSRPLKRHILHLESVALRSPTRFEARHVLKESREESLSLLRLKLLFSFPSSILSLLSFVSTVHASSSSSSLHRPSLLSTATAFKFAWLRVFATSICSYALFLAYVQLPQLFAAALRGHPWLSLPAVVIGSGLEVYVMGVLGLGLVVSALEEKFGWDAIRVGSGLVAGRRVCWWWVTCMLVAVSGWIGNRFEKLTDGGDSVKSGTWAVMMTRWETVGLLGFYAVVVTWSFIVTTVFYCDCKKRNNRINVNEGPDANGTDLTEFAV